MADGNNSEVDLSAQLKQVEQALFANEDSNVQRQALFEEFQKRFAVVNVQGKAMVIEDYDIDTDLPRTPEEFIFYSFAEFKNLFCNKTYQSMSESVTGKPRFRTNQYPDEWLKSPYRRQYMDGLTFDPSGKCKPTKKNMWTGFAIKPSDSVFPEKWLTFFLELVCSNDEELFNYLLNYYAHATQKPWELPGIALVFRGGKGVGKTTAVKPLNYIFGPHFYQTQNKDHVIGKYTAITQNKLVLYLNEAFGAGTKQSESILKGIITEPYRDIENKYIPVYQIQNYTRLVIDSNDDWAVPVSTDERRYCFINIPDHEHKADKPYFDAITHELTHGGAEGLLQLLLDRDISTFRPMELPEDNEVRGADMAQHSLNSVHKFLNGWLHDGGISDDRPFQSRMRKKDFYDHYLEFCKDLRVFVEPKPIFYAKSLEALGMKGFTKYDGYDVYRFPPLHEMRATFARLVMKTEVDWLDGVPPVSKSEKLKDLVET